MSNRINMKKTIFILIILSLISCSSKKSDINGIWIPQSVDWSDGIFKTFYFYNDTSLIILLSTQKYINDTIYFEAEPGFALSEGKIISLNRNFIEIESRVIYRYFTLPGESPIPTAWVKENLTLSYKKDSLISFDYKDEKYTKTNRYRSQNVEGIKDIAVKMVPDIKKTYNNVK